MSETTGGSIDIAPLMLEKLRIAARAQASLNTYTWIAPGHVLALLDTIDELEASLADTTALRARVAQLKEALQQSVELQSHYAELLNMHDGGQRLTFANVEAWLDRLAALKDAPQ